jgi:L-lactate dehydrogenase complex protein LldE
MPDPIRAAAGRPIRVGLFATCLVDLIRPRVGFATAKLLEDAGCTVEVPQQTCCGQPAFNSGDRKTARELAGQAIETFENYDYVVLPSGSCAGQVIVHYPELFEGDAAWEPRAKALAVKTFELTVFLIDVLKVTPAARFDGAVTYHDSCSGLRELGIHAQPRKLLGNVEGLHFVEMKDPDVCCGFGGTFCVKYPDVSNKIVEKKTANIAASGADTLLAGDLGCLMNMAGKLSREGKKLRVRHIAEVLAGMGEEPAIGEPER